METPLDDGRPLHAHAIMACVEGNTARLRELLRVLQPSDIGELLECNSWPDETTLLKVACGQGHLDVAKCLIGCGADPDDAGDDPEDGVEADSSRKAPIHLAAQCGHADLVRWLVCEGGAEARKCDRNGCNAYHLGCVQGHNDVVHFLVEEADLDVNEPDGAGGTGLGWAVKQGHAELAQWLREQGAVDTLP
mmetsp:Transcript_63202/g.105157  ORF Transcript_63202/g.105157 Transcript_63202/m.105157 type:complete len:192 (+) Transcript_63202:34-609(+)